MPRYQRLIVFQQTPPGNFGRVNENVNSIKLQHKPSPNKFSKFIQKPATLRSLPRPHTHNLKYNKICLNTTEHPLQRWPALDHVELLLPTWPARTELPLQTWLGHTELLLPIWPPSTELLLSTWPAQARDSAAPGATRLLRRGWTRGATWSSQSLSTWCRPEARAMHQ